MMKKHRASASPLLEPSADAKVDSSRNEQPVLKRKSVLEETLFEVSKEESSSTFDNLFFYGSDVSSLSSSEDETAPESTEDPVAIRDGTPYNDNGRHLLSSAAVSNDSVCHFSLPSTSVCDSELLPGVTHSLHQRSEEQVAPNISGTASRNSSKLSPTGSRAKVLVNLFLREMSAWSEPPPKVSASSEFDEEFFAKIKGNSNENRCKEKGKTKLRRLRSNSDSEYDKTKRGFEVHKKHNRSNTTCVGYLNKEKRFQGIASLDDITRQLLEVDIIKPLSMSRMTSGE